MVVQSQGTGYHLTFNSAGLASRLAQPCAIRIFLPRQLEQQSCGNHVVQSVKCNECGTTFSFDPKKVWTSPENADAKAESGGQLPTFTADVA